MSRFVTAIAGMVVAIAAIAWLPPVGVWVLAALVATLCIAELAALAQVRSSALVLAPGLLATAIPLLIPSYGTQRQLWLLLALLVAGVSAANAIRTRRGSAGWVALGGLWIGAPLGALVAADRSFEVAGHPMGLLVILTPVWAGDIAAYFVGRRYGRHKLAPAVSPGKSWEGAAANLVAAVALGAILSPLVPSLPAWRPILAAVAIGVFGQAGDLFESALKRSAGLKDSSSLLPGHGGILDRVDSLLFASIPAALLLLG